MCRNPLTGLNLVQPVETAEGALEFTLYRRNPLTGLNLVQRDRTDFGGWPRYDEVAIPLRG